MLHGEIMHALILILLILAAVCFFLYAFSIPRNSSPVARVSTLGLGLLFWELTNLIPLLIRLVVFALVLSFAGGCAENTGNLSNDARARTTNVVITKAVQILGQFAVDSLLGTAKVEMATNGNSDMGHSAAQGVWSQAANWATSKGIELAVKSFSARTLPRTAEAAKDAFAGSSAAPAVKADAIASVISTAAGAPPKR